MLSKNSGDHKGKDLDIKVRSKVRGQVHTLPYLGLKGVKYTHNPNT
jgi:hypothetical protein